MCFWTTAAPSSSQPSCDSFQPCAQQLLQFSGVQRRRTPGTPGTEPTDSGTFVTSGHPVIRINQPGWVEKAGRWGIQIHPNEKYLQCFSKFNSFHRSCLWRENIRISSHCEVSGKSAHVTWNSWFSWFPCCNDARFAFYPKARSRMKNHGNSHRNSSVQLTNCRPLLPSHLPFSTLIPVFTSLPQADGAYMIQTKPVHSKTCICQNLSRTHSGLAVGVQVSCGFQGKKLLDARNTA